MTKAFKKQKIKQKQHVAPMRRTVGGGSVEVPPAIVALWREFAGVGDPARLGRNQARFRELWRIFTVARERISPDLLQDPRDAEAYLSGFHLPNVARAMLLLHRMANRAGVKRLADLFVRDFKHQRIFDLGCGSGAWSHAWLSEVQLQRNSVHLIDSSPALLNIAAEGVSRLKQGFSRQIKFSPAVYVDAVAASLDSVDFDLYESRQTVADKAASGHVAPVNETLDVCILGYVWNEISGDSKAKARLQDYFEGYVRRGKDGLLILAEPATDELAWSAMELRDWLCERGWVTIYPCPASVAKCPMLKGHGSEDKRQRRDWCFSEGAWRKPADYAAFEKATGIAHSKLNSAIFALASPALAQHFLKRVPQLQNPVQVVVGKPASQSGVFSYLVCTPSGLQKTPPRRIDPKYAKPRGSLVKAVLPLFIAMLVSTFPALISTSCSRAGDVTSPSVPEKPKLAPPFTSSYANLDILPPKALSRRLAFDLNDLLDSNAIADAISSSGVSAGVSLALQSDRFPHAASRFFGPAFGVGWSAAADLESMAESDPDFSALLTPAMREGIIAEADFFFERMLASSGSAARLGSVFSGVSSVAGPAVVALWGGAAGQPVFPGRSEVAFQYTDGRPGLGILTTQGFIASSGTLGGALEMPEDRLGARLLQTIRCTSFHSSHAHDFSTVSASAISASGLASYRLTARQCVGCHGQMAQAGKAILGLGNDGSVADYRVYDPAAGGAVPSNWFGTTTASWVELSDAIFSDEATRACLSQRLLEAMMQRSAIPERDGNRMATIAMTTMTAETNISEWLARVAGSPANTSGPTLKSSRASADETQVRKTRWRDPVKLLNALKQEAPLASSALDDLITQTAGLARGFLAGASVYELRVDYAANVWQVAIDAAAAIIDAEFAAGITPGQRQLFSGILDLASIDAEDAVSAITVVWSRWTGDDPGNPRRDDLRDLYEVALAHSSHIQPERDALVAMLASLLSSPLFLSY
jgi:hypothetical protein